MNKEVKKSKLIARTNGDIIRLQAFHDRLVPCNIENRNEDLMISYNLEELIPFKEIKKEFPMDQIKTLINTGKLYDLAKEYIIDLSPENIYVDINYLPKMLDRDVCNEDIYTDNEDFICQYKSLIGSTLQIKYKYEDYYLGGLDLLKKDARMKEIYSCNNIEEIVELLKREYKKESSILNIKSVIVRRNKLRIHRIIELIAIIGVLVLGTFSGYNHLIVMPYQQKLMDADNYYIHEEYEKVLTELDKASLTKIPVETKYVLAQSYYNVNKVLFDQSKAKPTDLSLSSDVELYNYWIQLYRGSYEDAINTAKKIQNNDYLLYAYNQQYSEVAKDNSLDGEDKQVKLDSIKSCIKELESDMEEESEKEKTQVTNSK